MKHLILVIITTLFSSFAYSQAQTTSENKIENNTTAEAVDFQKNLSEAVISEKDVLDDTSKVRAKISEEAISGSEVSVDTLEAQKKRIENLEKENRALNDSIKKNTQLFEALSSLSNRLNLDDDGNKKERVQLGLSFAYGELYDEDKSEYRMPAINPFDSTLVYQNLDGRFVLVSTTMTVSPFLYADWLPSKDKIEASRTKRMIVPKKIFWWLFENSGASININFLEIATGNSEQSFNQIVEGGIGYSLRINKNIYFSFSRELKFINSLNDSFNEGEPIYLNGQKIANINELDVADQNYYHTKTLLHWSSRIIVNF